MKSFAKLLSAILLAVVMVVQVACSVGAISSSRTLNVPKEQQEQTCWCWAACGVSTVNYMKNTNYTQTEFCGAAIGSVTNRFATVSEVQSGLDYCGFNSEKIYNLENNVDIYDIKNNIDAGKPLIASRIKVLVGHEVVICGYSLYDNQSTATIVYMNPSYGKNYTILYDYFGDISTPPSTDSEMEWVASSIWNYTIYNITRR